MSYAVASSGMGTAWGANGYGPIGQLPAGPIRYGGQMGSLSEAAKLVLEPFAGAMIAGMCVRSAAAAAGKDPEALTAADFLAFKNSAVSILRPLAPANAIDGLLAEIEKRAQ